MITDGEHNGLDTGSRIFLENAVNELCRALIADVSAVGDITRTDENLGTGERYLARRRITGRGCSLQAEVAAVASKREDRNSDPQNEILADSRSSIA